MIPFRNHGEDVINRLMRMLVLNKDCWEWSGYVNKSGYAAAWFNGKKTGVHRLAYITFIGDIPDGMVLDHSCSNRICYNPNHLEAVKQSENLDRGETVITTINKNKDYCVNGHEFTLLNTYRRSDRKTRECKSCRSNAVKEHYNRRLELHRG